MNVQRYELEIYHCNGGEMLTSETGDYVSHEDYAALEAKCAALAAELKQSHIDASCYKKGMEASNERLVQVAAENAGLNAFVDALLSIAWQGGSADGAEIQELALKHGLLRQEFYSADEHETLVDDPGNFEDGDPVYFRVETPTPTPSSQSSGQ